MFTDPAATVRRGLEVRFQMNSIYVTIRRSDDDCVSLIEGDGTLTTSVGAAEAILSNGAGERL